MKRSLAYQIAADIRERNASLLFQRLNYFYIVMAFLIAAVMTSYAVSNQSNQTYVTSIRTVLVIFGLVISLYFTFLNYWNTRILAGIRDYTLKLEVGDFCAYSGENGPLVRAKWATREKAGGRGAGMVTF
jgi:hypothetical protein